MMGLTKQEMIYEHDLVVLFNLRVYWLSASRYKYFGVRVHCSKHTDSKGQKRETNRAEQKQMFNVVKNQDINYRSSESLTVLGILTDSGANIHHA